eukprot:932041-Pyramimonas_sp.AAC.1
MVGACHYRRGWRRRSGGDGLSLLARLEAEERRRQKEEAFAARKKKVREYALSPNPIGTRCEYMLPPHIRLVRAASIRFQVELMRKKTKKGQPVMKHRIDDLLSKIEAGIKAGRK